MDGTGRPGGTEAYIWLRYATQYTLDGRTHTIEMGIPVPLGASAETRERLIREAQVGMDQLAGHVEQRVNQLTRRQAGQAPAPRPASVPPAKPVPAPTAPAQPQPQQPRETTQAAQAPVAAQSKEPSASRQTMGATTPTGPADSSSSMKLPQFLQYIKEMGLDGRQVMEMLKVKSLSGLNLREALEQLQRMVAQEPGRQGAPTQLEQRQREAAGPGGAKPEVKNTSASPPASPSRPAAAPAPSGPPSIPAPVAQAQPVSKIPGIKEISGVVREVRAPLTFDEEIDMEGEDELELDEVDFMPELTEQDRDLAEGILTRLREARGSTLAGPQRLVVLNNVLGEQLTEEQLQLLLQGIWNAPNARRLKNDQLEALISWAKEDDFVSEAEAVLSYLQEEEYARSDR